MLNHNGTIYSNPQTPLFTAQNRAFRYGDGIFETMRIFSNATHPFSFWEMHSERLLRGVQTLGMRLPLSSDELHRQILLTFYAFARETPTLLNPPPDLRLRLTIWRGGTGFYTPETDTAEYLIEITPLPDGTPNGYTLNREGLRICTARHLFANIPQNGLRAKTLNALPYIMAAKHARDEGFDDAILLNQSGDAVEGSRFNLFARSGSQLLLPPTAHGATDGITARLLATFAPRLGYRLTETPFTPRLLATADELFLTNAIEGIRWVNLLRTPDRQYTYPPPTAAPQFIDALNHAIEKA